MADIIFEVPPGLGDISWCYSKIRDLVFTKRVGFRICNDKPLRSLDFVSLLVGVDNLGFGRSYADTRKVLLPYDTDLMALGPGTYAISLNPWLEAGKRIELAFPKQTTHYHYQMVTSFEQRRKAEAVMRLASPDDQPVVGFYCSSYAHRPDLGFWDAKEWVQFLTMVRDLIPDVRFVALGAKFDDKTMDTYKLMVAAGFNVTSAIGTFDCGASIELIHRLDYFFAFPSGLAILADVVNTPCMMWYWSNVLKEFANFPNTYADPDTIRQHYHINLPYIKAQESFNHFRLWGLPHLKARAGI